MSIKDNSTEKLIRMSEGIRKEITLEILDDFGIDLSTQKCLHHEKTKPVWTQLIRDHKSLKNELDSFLKMVKENLDYLPEMMSFEREHPFVICDNPSKDSISYDLEFLWICESHVKKFERENYLSKKDIIKYQTTIQRLRDKIRKITIDESLQV